MRVVRPSGLPVDIPATHPVGTTPREIFDLAGLTNRQRLVLAGADAGMTVAEIAKASHCSEATVSRDKRRGFARLRWLRQQPNPPESVTRLKFFANHYRPSS